MVTAKTIGWDGEEEQIQNTINSNNRNYDNNNTGENMAWIRL